jgi:hypothetical protein
MRTALISLSLEPVMSSEFVPFIIFPPDITAIGNSCYSTDTQLSFDSGFENTALEVSDTRTCLIVGFRPSYSIILNSKQHIGKK